MGIEVKLSIAVQDSYKGFAISGAIVTLVPDSLSAGSKTHSQGTASTGYASFTGVEVGIYTIAIKANHYTSLSISGVTIEADNLVEIVQIKGRLIPPGHLINVTGTVPTVKLDPVDYLLFNGKQLCWMKGDHQHKCWSAVSGRKGFQAKAHQSAKDKGPLPEGRWSVEQTQHQNIGNRGLFEETMAELGRTAWPGGESAWGKNRIWLRPKAGTQTHNRSGFSIHGGDDPGSAGCIDMTKNMPSFVKEFLQHGKDLELEVKYED